MSNLAIQITSFVSKPIKQATPIVAIAAISGIALAIIGLISPHLGFTNALSHLGNWNFPILGASIFLLIVDLALVALFHKNGKKGSISIRGTAKPTPFKPLPYEINQHIVSFVSDFKTFVTISQLNKDGYSLIQELWKVIDLRQFIPKLTIFDKSAWRKRLGDISLLNLEFGPQPTIDNLALAKLIKRLLAPQVICNDGGVALITIPKGLKRLHLLDATKDDDRILPLNVLKTWEDLPLEKTCTILITEKDLNRKIGPDKFLKEIGCRHAKPIEYMSLFVLSSNTSTSIHLHQKVEGISRSMSYSNENDPVSSSYYAVKSFY